MKCDMRNVIVVTSLLMLSALITEAPAEIQTYFDIATGYDEFLESAAQADAAMIKIDLVDDEIDSIEASGVKYVYDSIEVYSGIVSGPASPSGYYCDDYFTYDLYITNVPTNVTFTHTVTYTSIDGNAGSVAVAGSATDDGTISTYHWDFGDNTPDRTGQSITHVYAEPGTYDVTLTVTDNNGARASTTEQVFVSGLPQKDATATRLFAFDSGVTPTQFELDRIDDEFLGFTRAQQDEFATLPGGSKLRDANETNEPAQAHHKPIYFSNGNYWESTITEERRCQQFVSMHNSPYTVFFTPTAGIRYKYGFDFELVDGPWFQDFKSHPWSQGKAFLSLMEFHTSELGDSKPAGYNIPGAQLGLYLYSLGDASKAPSLMFKIAGDQLADSGARTDFSWASGMLNVDGKTLLWIPLSNEWSGGNITNTFNLNKMGAGQVLPGVTTGVKYRVLVDVVFDVADGTNPGGYVKAWINGVQFVDISGITNAFMIDHPNYPLGLTGREPQIGIDHPSRNVWPQSNVITVQNSNVFLDEY